MSIQINCQVKKTRKRRQNKEEIHIKYNLSLYKKRNIEVREVKNMARIRMVFVNSRESEFS